MRNVKAFSQRSLIFVVAVCSWMTVVPHLRAETLSVLAARGYAVLPVPQKVMLGSQNFALTDGWQLVLEPWMKSDDVAVESLKEQLLERFHLRLAESKTARGGGGIIRLAVVPGSVAIGEATDRNKPGLAGQAYRLSLKPQEVSLGANASAGLFYGIQTLVQLIRPEGNRWLLPEGEISD